MKQAFYAGRTLLFVVLVLSIQTLRVEGQKMEVSGANLPPYNPTNLVTNTFQGDGIEILEVKFDGNPASVGYFDYSQQAIGVERGILLTTGIATKAARTGKDGAQDNNDPNQKFTFDPDLALIANGAPLRNIVRYTIRFIPQADSLRFRYVFASEEYPEFVCSEFNDVFGFFISGPGIAGPFDGGAENIARIPGTTLPVAINNVNGGSMGVWGDFPNCLPPRGSLNYPHFFVNNQNTDQQPVFDGFTKVFVAQAKVVPCQEYTIKLIVADVTDEGYDSGVFLEAKSFSTNSLKIVAETESPDGTIGEGCSPGMATLKFAEKTPVDVRVDLNYGGTATNGVDYEQLPATVTIPAGQDSVSLHIRAINDGIAESVETISISYQKNICQRDTAIFYVQDWSLPRFDLPDTAVCRDQVVYLDGQQPVATGSLKEFSNRTAIPIVPTLSAVYSEIEVSGVVPDLPGPKILESVCLNIQHNKPEDLDLYLIAPSGRFVLLASDLASGGADFQGTCFSPAATQSIADPGSTAPWTGSFLPEGRLIDLWEGGGPVNGTWRLLLIDDETGNNGILNSWSLRFNPLERVTYSWSPAQGVDCADCPEVNVPVAAPVTLVLTVADQYGCTSVGESQIDLLPLPAPPAIVCGAATPTSVEVRWDSVPTTVHVELSVAGGDWIPFGNAASSYRLEGLAPGDVVQFDVRSIGPCTGEPISLTCHSLNCIPPELEVRSIQDVRCPGESSGRLRVSATGSGPYIYHLRGDLNLSNPQGEFENLPKGQYLVVVDDTLGCSQSMPIEIKEPAPITIAVQTDSTSCHDTADGLARVLPSGGTPGYTIVWSDGKAGDVRLDLPKGKINATVIDQHNCATTISVVILAPAPLKLEATAENPSCAGDSTGRILVTALGGNGSNLYGLNGAAKVSTGVFSGLPSGKFLLSVSDRKQCLAEKTIELTDPPALELSGVVTYVKCYGGRDGAIQAQVLGGTGQINYHWSGPADFYASERVISFCPAGQYVLTVQDVNLCQKVHRYEIKQPEQLTTLVETIPASCTGRNDGEIFVLPEGGTAPYLISLNGLPAVANDHFVELKTGDYDIEITDNNGCIYRSENNLIGDSKPLSVELGGNLTIKAGESVQLSPVISSANPIEQYQWVTEHPEIMSCTDCESPSVSPQYQTVFKLLVTDSRGCRGYDLVTVFVQKDYAVYVPTGFSPNGDGINDVLLVHGQASTRVKLFRIFDRWGELLFESSDFYANEFAGAWDGSFRGQAVNTGVFIWHVKVEYQDGTTQTYLGDCTLIR
jgi:gliding motility-associated-like protein